MSPLYDIVAMIFYQWFNVDFFRISHTGFLILVKEDKGFDVDHEVKLQVHETCTGKIFR